MCALPSGVRIMQVGIFDLDYFLFVIMVLCKPEALPGPIHAYLYIGTSFL